MRLLVRQQQAPSAGPASGSTEIRVNEKRPLGRGATATVFDVLSPDFVGKVAKIYHARGQYDGAKIRAMLATPPPLKYAANGNQEVHPFAWPSHVVYDAAGAPVGYLMPKIGDSDSLPLNFFFERLLAKSKLPVSEQSLTARIRIARNLSALLAVLHQHKHYVIDFKPQNTKVFLNGLFVAILDCDSFSIQGEGSRRFPATNYTSEYIAPEALRGQAAPQGLLENQDRFALAVVLFQLLNNGIHPFQGIMKAEVELPTTDDRVRGGYYPYGRTAHPSVRPCIQSIHECFDDRLRDLFDRAFTGSAESRPAASEWSDYFKGVLNERRLQRCDSHPNDPTHIRFEGKACGLCHFDRILSTPLTAKATLSPVSKNQNHCATCGRRSPKALVICPNCGTKFGVVGSAAASVTASSHTTVPSPPPSSGWGRLLAVMAGIAVLAGIAGLNRCVEPSGGSTGSSSAWQDSSQTAVPPPPTYDQHEIFRDRAWVAHVVRIVGEAIPVRCFVESLPAGTNGGAAETGRKLIVTIYPSVGSASYAFAVEAPYADGTQVQLQIDAGYFALSTYAGAAMPPVEDIFRIIYLLREGIRATSTGSAASGGTTTDTYSLRGFRSSYAAAAQACNAPALAAP